MVGPSSAPSAARPVIVLLIGLFFPLVFWAFLDMRANLEGSAAAGGAGVALTLRAVQIGLGVYVAVVLAIRARKAPRELLALLRDGFQLRLWLYAVAAGALVPSIATAMGLMVADSLLAGSVLVSSALIGWAIWIVAVATVKFPASLTGSGPLRWIDLALFNAIVLMLLAEFLAVGIQRFMPSPLLWDDSSAASMVEQLRAGDGTEFLRYNSRGYPDEEFFEAGPDDYKVALVTDSFGVGSVPYRYNFATVAERILQSRLGSHHDRVAVDNYGIIIINMAEYLHLLSTEVLPTDPDQVVLAIFVGNDIDGMRRNRSRDRSRLQNWLVVQTARRLTGALGGVESFDREWATDVETAEDPPFVHDPSLEEPYFTEAAFLEVERERFEFCNTKSAVVERRYEDFFEALALAHEWVGSKLLVLLIPDEFQVNDELFRKVQATRRNPADYDRDYPQRRIVEWCRRRGVRVLDLLPHLRQAEAQGHTYHLRDTHWNARGNRVAGEALAEQLLAF